VANARQLIASIMEGVRIIVCPRCNGLGQVERDKSVPFVLGEELRPRCPRCEGCGESTTTAMGETSDAR